MLRPSVRSPPIAVRAASPVFPRIAMGAKARPGAGASRAQRRELSFPSKQASQRGAAGSGRRDNGFQQRAGMFCHHDGLPHFGPIHRFPTHPPVSKGATSLPDRLLACAPVALPWRWPGVGREGGVSARLCARSRWFRDRAEGRGSGAGAALFAESWQAFTCGSDLRGASRHSASATPTGTDGAHRRSATSAPRQGGRAQKMPRERGRRREKRRGGSLRLPSPSFGQRGAESSADGGGACSRGGAGGGGGEGERPLPLVLIVDLQLRIYGRTLCFPRQAGRSGAPALSERGRGAARQPSSSAGGEEPGQARITGPRPPGRAAVALGALLAGFLRVAPGPLPLWQNGRAGRP